MSRPAILVRESVSPEETEEIGRGLARRLGPGSVVLLYGGIGAGKSVLARGLIQALPGGEGRAVPSPTFVFIRHHPTTPPVHHVDLYRLPAGFDPGELGLDELAGGEGIVIIEWAQRLEGTLFPGAASVRIEGGEGSRRRISIKFPEGGEFSGGGAAEPGGKPGAFTA